MTVAGLVLLLPLALQAGTAAAPGATVTFVYTNAALDPSTFTLVTREDGKATYQSKPGPAAGPETRGLDRDAVLGTALRAQLFAAARHDHLFATDCSLKNSHVAYTGDKTFSYQGAEGAGSCTFNYARIPALQSLASSLIAVARTMEEGRKLETLLAHDKLGVDAEMEELASEQADGRALELENIAPILHAIVADDGVLNRTRTRAQTLLDEAAKPR